MLLEDDMDKKLNFYFVEREDGADWDEYDSAVVVAYSSKDAIAVIKEKWDWGWGAYQVKVRKINPTTRSVIIGSFNAG
jgi:hypothetical protein